MQLQFPKNNLTCMQRLTRQVQNQEQTQEVRLPDEMPDIGSVLGAWGQVVLRGKEWRGSGMQISGGVMVWILYVPENGSAPQCVETWLPFQMKWDFPDPQHDGSILASCLLRNVDARSISARKLMVRAGVAALGQAYVPGQISIHSPGELPEDVQILKRSYPMLLPAECGEKTFLMEEELTMPSGGATMERLLRYELRPEVQDQKVVAGKVVFRGMAMLHLVFLGNDGNLHTWDYELPFSQFGELDQDYEQDAQVQVYPAVTNLELDRGENGMLQLKCGLLGQYVVCNRQVVELVEDAYSPFREVTPRKESMQIPAVLDSVTQTLRAEQEMGSEGGMPADVSFYPDFPGGVQEGDEMQIQVPGQFQMLYYDADGVLKGTTSRWEGGWSLPAEPGSDLEMTAAVAGNPQSVTNGMTMTARGDVRVQATVMQQQGMEAVTELELGEMTEPDPARPGLILRRMRDCSLWELAKQCGSTVQAIENANHLQGEPGADQMLLIPVM